MFKEKIMKKTYKVIALLSTAFALAACQSGEKKVDETSAQTTVAQATTQAPTTQAATSKAQRVRVEVFSKISAIFLPLSCCSSVPAYLAHFKSRDKSNK